MAKQILTNLDFNNQAKVTNLVNGTEDQDAVTVAQLNAAIEGLAHKDNVKVRTSSNISIASPGASLDGISLSINDRVLVAGQADQTENGIYVFNGSAVPMTRSLDANTGSELVNAIVPVDEGTSTGSVWRQTSVGITLGSTNIVFVPFGTTSAQATEASAGVAEIATQAEVDSGADNLRFVTPQKLAAYVNKKLKFSQVIGDGSATQFTITHNLNTRDLQAIVRRESGAYDEVIADVEFPTVNTCVIRFATAPASNSFKAIVLG